MSARDVDDMEDAIDDLLMRRKSGKYIAQTIANLGYRKPRTITTAEELDALPIGSVVLSDTYRHFVDEWRVAFQRWSDGEWHRGARAICTHPDNFLPATLMHDPEARS
jgi:ribonucleotide monophosphatase NagD (HAD superfamily)